MFEETAILGDENRIDEMVRKVGEAHQDTVSSIRRKERADLGWFDTGRSQCTSVCELETRDHSPWAEKQEDRFSRLPTACVAKGSCADPPFARADGVFASTHVGARDEPIARSLQVLGDTIAKGVDSAAQHQGAAVKAGRPRSDSDPKALLD
jgi:hypothetical protein